AAGIEVEDVGARTAQDVRDGGIKRADVEDVGGAAALERLEAGERQGVGAVVVGLGAVEVPGTALVFARELVAAAGGAHRVDAAEAARVGAVTTGVAVGAAAGQRHDDVAGVVEGVRVALPGEVRSQLAAGI